MKLIRIFCGFFIIILTQIQCAHHSNENKDLKAPMIDENLWLEDIDGVRSMDWVKAHNTKSLEELQGDPRYKKIYADAEKISLAQDRIPTGSYRGGFIYNFWQDETHTRGTWRRTTLAEYKKKKPQWETLLDIDELAKSEKENWVYKGSNCLAPDYTFCLISLSRGGKDASVWREFNLKTKKFVADGFYLPEAKSSVEWRDSQSLFVGTDWGSDSLTTSGYPRFVKIWNRGTPLSGAKSLFSAQATDVAVDAFVVHRAEKQYEFILQRPTFWTSIIYLIGPNDKLIKAPIPQDAHFIGILNGQMILLLRSQWDLQKTGRSESFPSGSVVSLNYDELIQQKTDPKIMKVFLPTEKKVASWAATSKEVLYISVLDNVKSRLTPFTIVGDHWEEQMIPLPTTGSIDSVSFNDLNEDNLVTYENFLTPRKLFLINSRHTELLKTEPAHFNTQNLKVIQNFARSADGTEVPYFLISSQKASGKRKVPTILYGYGGFEHSMTPWFSNLYGKLWLERGGAFAVANIRGGGEFGPRWHYAALRENRQRAFDDFISVGEDLIKKGLTDSEHLGISGGSNGGLLVGAVFVQRPELFKAVVCQVPLLDMLRYNKLLAGASWMDEYGNPDKPEDLAYILKYSPYQNLKKETKYPKVFFLTSTKDDRVHPGHARKMAARMESFGNSLYYYENIDGGHGAAANLKEKARRISLELIYFSRMLDLK